MILDVDRIRKYAKMVRYKQGSNYSLVHPFVQVRDRDIAVRMRDMQFRAGDALFARY